MRLNSDQIGLVGEFLRNRVDTLPEELITVMELGVWLPNRMRADVRVPELPSALVLEADGPLFLSGSFTRRTKEHLLAAFKQRVLPYVLVRVEASWQCYINCKGEVLESTCAEDKDATSLCCEGLRSKCGVA